MIVLACFVFEAGTGRRRPSKLAHVAVGCWQNETLAFGYTAGAGGGGGRGFDLTKVSTPHNIPKLNHPNLKSTQNI